MVQDSIKWKYIKINKLTEIILLFHIIVIVCYLPFAENELFGKGTLLFGILYFLFLWFCVRRRIGGNLFLFLVLFIIVLYGQRILFLLMDPNSFTYQKTVYICRTDINMGLAYLFFASVIVLIGILASNNILKRGINVKTGWFSNYKYRARWILISYIFILFKLIVMFYFKIGIVGIGISIPMQYLLRPLNILGIIIAVNFWLLLDHRISLFRWERMGLIWSLVLFLLIEIISTTRAAILIFLLFFLFYKIFSGDENFTRKTLFFIIMLFFIGIFFTGIATALRNVMINYYYLNVYDNFFHMFFTSLTNRLNVTAVFNFISQRLNGFDILVAMIAKKSELSIYYNITNTLKAMLNSLVPGELYQNVYSGSCIIPMVLQGLNLADFFSYGAHPNFLGLTILNFGILGGGIFIFMWSFISSIVLSLRLNLFVKIAYIQIWIFQFFETGLIEDSFARFTDAIVMFFILFIAIRLRVYRCVNISEAFSTDNLMQGKEK